MRLHYAAYGMDRLRADVANQQGKNKPLTLSQYYNYEKSMDPNTQTRRRRCRRQEAYGTAHIARRQRTTAEHVEP